VQEFNLFNQIPLYAFKIILKISIKKPQKAIFDL